MKTAIAKAFKGIGERVESFTNKVTAKIDSVDSKLGFKQPEPVKVKPENGRSKPDEIKKQSIVSQSSDIKAISNQDAGLLIGYFPQFCSDNVKESKARQTAAAAVVEVNQGINETAEKVGSIETKLVKNKDSIKETLQAIMVDIDTTKKVESNPEESTGSTHGLTAEFHEHNAKFELVKSEFHDLAKQVEVSTVKVMHIKEKIEKESEVLNSDLNLLATAQLKEESLLFKILYIIFGYGADDIKVKADAIKNTLQAKLQTLENELTVLEKNKMEADINHSGGEDAFIAKKKELDDVTGLLAISKELDVKVLGLVNKCQALKLEAGAMFKEADAKLVTVENLLGIQEANVAEPEMSEADKAKIAKLDPSWQKLIADEKQSQREKKAAQAEIAKKAADDFKGNLEKLSVLQKDVEAKLVGLRTEIADLSTAAGGALGHHGEGMKSVLKDALLQLESLENFTKRGADMLRLIQENSSMVSEKADLECELYTLEGSKESKLRDLARAVNTGGYSESLGALDEKSVKIAKDAEAAIERYNNYGERFLEGVADLKDKTPVEVVGRFKKANIPSSVIDRAIKYGQNSQRVS